MLRLSWKNDILNLDLLCGSFMVEPRLSVYQCTAPYSLWEFYCNYPVSVCCLGFEFGKINGLILKGVTCLWGRGREELCRRPDCLWYLSSFTGVESHILALCAIGCSQSKEETVPQSHGPGCWCVSPSTVSVVIP
jgi:hypothetical protein